MPHHAKRARNRFLEICSGALIRTRDATHQGVHTQTLKRMLRSGELERVGPGRYCVTTDEVTENHSLLVAASSVPCAVICL